MSAPRIAILGTGPLGHAIANACRGVPRVWGRSEAGRARIGAVFGDKIEVVASLEDACRDADILCMAVPADGVWDIVTALGPVAKPDQIVLHGTRGVSPGFVLPSDMLRAHTCIRQIGALGGAIYRQGASTELIGGILGAPFDDVHLVLAEAFHVSAGRVHASDDLRGVEVCGSIGNVTELAIGMAEALAYDPSSIGAVSAYGLADATRVGRALGAKVATFHGMAGVGELLPRQALSTGRHRRLGQRLGEGASLEAAREGLEGAVEGIDTAREVVAFAERRGLKLPLCTAVADVLAGRRTSADALAGVLQEELAWA